MCCDGDWGSTLTESLIGALRALRWPICVCSGVEKAVECYTSRLLLAVLMVVRQSVGLGCSGAMLTLWLQEYQGTLERDGQTELHVKGKAGDTLDVLLENMGRISFGANFSDFKVRKEGLRAAPCKWRGHMWPNTLPCPQPW